MLSQLNSSTHKPLLKNPETLRLWNIYGDRFMITGPGVNLEVNLSDIITFVAGVSYRTVSGIDPNNEYVDITHVTSQEMSGVNFNIGLKFSKISKK